MSPHARSAPFAWASRRKNTQDGTGVVRVQVVLLDVGERVHRKGNITRSWHVRGTRVSDVAEAIERVLFDWQRPEFRSADRQVDTQVEYDG